MRTNANFRLWQINFAINGNFQNWKRNVASFDLDKPVVNWYLKGVVREMDKAYTHFITYLNDSRYLAYEKIATQQETRTIMITGNHELSVKELEEKLGLLAHTSQCCASGTHASALPQDLSLPTISWENDSRDPVALKAKYGPLF